MVNCEKFIRLIYLAHCKKQSTTLSLRRPSRNCENIPVCRAFGCDIFYLCLFYGVYSNELKIAKIFPFYKDGAHDNSNNYRPISVL